MGTTKIAITLNQNVVSWIFEKLRNIDIIKLWEDTRNFC